MIKLKINVSKIDKARLFKGEKGTYLDCVLIDTPDGKYGDYMIVQEVTKEERQSGVKGTIIGNAKNFGGPRNSGPSSHSRPDNHNHPPARSEPKPAAQENLDQDVPF